MTDRHRRLPLLLLTVAASLALAGCGGDRAESVVLLTIDTLRADHVGAYSGAHVETPALDRLAAEGVLFEEVVAPFSRTTQSLGSIHTGLHPLTHGADGLGMTLPAEWETLAERFAAEGYRTAAFATNLVIKPGRGFEQGFEIFSNPRTRWKGNSATSITSEAIAWLEALEEDEPFFLWLHYLDPHWPYRPPDDLVAEVTPAWDGAPALFDAVDDGSMPKGKIVFEADTFLDEDAIENMRRLYAAEIEATDRAVGALFEHLEATGRFDRTLLVFTSDHGESLGDHRYWFAHGEYIYDDTLRVPWIVRAPGRVAAGRRIAGTVRLEDVAPTLLDLAGFDVPAGLDGRSLADLARGSGTGAAPEATAIHVADHRLVHPENPRRPVPGREGRWFASRADGWKLLQVPQADGTVREELYDTGADPREAVNLIDEHPERAAGLRDALDAFRAAHPVPDDESGDASVDADLETLRSLGYAN